MDNNYPFKAIQLIERSSALIRTKDKLKLIKTMEIRKLIKWSALSRMAGGVRELIRSNKPVPEKYHELFDKVFLEDIPNWWKEKKKESKNKKRVEKREKRRKRNELRRMEAR